MHYIDTAYREGEIQVQYSTVYQLAMSALLYHLLERRRATSRQGLYVKGVEMLSVLPRLDSLAVVGDIVNAEATIEANFAIAGVGTSRSSQRGVGARKPTNAPSAAEAVPHAFDTSAVLGD